MECPGCGSTNLPGKLFCFRCGAKLTETGGAAPPGLSRRARKRRGPSAVFLVIVLVLGLVTVVAVQTVKQPTVEPAQTSENDAREGQMKLQKMKLDVGKGKRVEIALGEGEVNSLIALGYTGEPFLETMAKYCGPGVSLEAAQVAFTDDRMEACLTLFVEKKFIKKRLFLRVAGSLALRGGVVELVPDWIKLGELAVPPARAERILGWLAASGKPFRAEVGSEVWDISVKDGKLNIVAGKGGAPAAGGEAEALMNRASEVANGRELGLALELYRKVSTDYPDSPVAENARSEALAIQQMAEAMMSAAAKYHQDANYTLAESTYTEAAHLFRRMPEGAQAETKLNELRQDPEVKKALDKTRVESQARSEFEVAENFFRAKLYDRAKEYYERVASRYPDTSYAVEAKKRLAEIEAGGP